MCVRESGCVGLLHYDGLNGPETHTQHYDVLDVEGAHLVFERLTALCGNDADEALRLVDGEMRGK